MIFCLQIDAENACKNQRRPAKNLRLLPLTFSLYLKEEILHFVQETG
jgi:hypothetical protein